MQRGPRFHVPTTKIYEREKLLDLLHEEEDAEVSNSKSKVQATCESRGSPQT